jgi:AICAR transformylase/IMP cyclohydrolase PurH
VLPPIAITRPVAVPRHVHRQDPHQKAALYAEQAVGQKPVGMTSVKLLSGPELSFNNLKQMNKS